MPDASYALKLLAGALSIGFISDFDLNPADPSANNVGLILSESMYLSGTFFSRIPITVSLCRTLILDLLNSKHSLTALDEKIKLLGNGSNVAKNQYTFLVWGRQKS